MWPGLDADDFGEYASVTIDTGLYTEAAVFRTAYWFTDHYYVFLDRTVDGKIVVELRAKADGAGSLQSSCARFCNSLIDFRVRELVAAEASATRDALVTKAFLEGVPKPGFESVISNEGHVGTTKASQ